MLQAAVPPGPTGVVLDFNLVSLVVGTVSLVMGGYAIWLSLRFKEQADRVNEKTSDLLMDIRTDAKVISAYAGSELRSFGETSRQVILGVMSSGSASPPTGPVQSPQNITAGDFILSGNNGEQK